MCFGSLCLTSPSPLLLVFFAAFGAGCGLGPEDSTIDTVFDPCETLVLSLAEGTTAPEALAVTTGAELWNDRAFSRLTLGSAEDAAVLPVEFDEAALAFRGLYDDENGIVFVNRRIEDATAMSITVAHEIGHAFGLRHISPDRRRSIMNPGNVSSRPTEEDVAALAELWGACTR